jgi:dTDP-4-amino-4,6-dideoxygalactose transaminase
MIEYENLGKSNLPFLEEYSKKFRKVTERGWFILGEEVKNFETAFASYCGTEYCIGVGNGLDALTIALNSFSFPKGKEVIVPSNTYIATILAILNSGLKPVLVEPDISTYNIAPDLIEGSITRKTVAILVVHLYGKCCDMESILDIAAKNNLRVIEDCAQAHGAMFKNQKAGTFGDLSAFSFYPTKNLGCLGDGASLNTNSSDLAKKIRMLRNYGSEKKYYHEIIGVNSRLDELQAAFLNVKLLYLDRINLKKRQLAEIYNKELKDDFIKPNLQDDYYDIYHIYNIRHPERDELKHHLENNGIKTEIHYPVPPHRQIAMAGVLDHRPYPISEEIHATTLSLPISFFHTDEDVYKVVSVLNTF